MTQRLNSNIIPLGQYLESGERPHLVGTREYFQHADYSQNSPIVPIDARTVYAMLVKNGHASNAMLPRTVVEFGTGTDEWGKIISDVCGDGELWAGVVDPWLPAAGAPVGSLFWMIVGGPVQVISSGATTHAVGAPLMSAASGKVKARSAESVIDAFLGNAEQTATNVDGTILRINLRRRL